MSEKVKIEIARAKYPDGWNYYLTVLKYYGETIGWVVVDGAQKETILSRQRAEEVKKELLEQYKD
jgi:hypothetical protein